MIESDTATEAFWRTQGMARALGLNFSKAMASGWITAQGYAELVARCSLCTNRLPCLAWLGEHGALSPRAPEFCDIGRRLEALAHPH
jgi:hypothetical protein